MLRSTKRLALVVAMLALLTPSVPLARAVDLPILASNVELLGNVPDLGAISATFDPKRPYMYLSTVHGLDVYDVRVVEQPKLVGAVPMAMYQNENVDMGRVGVRPDGTTFVLMGSDLAAVTPTAPGSSVVSMAHLYVVDVTNPAEPFIRSDLETTTFTHTVSCLDMGCRYAYTAGDFERFSVVDLRDLDNPKEVRVIDNPWGWHDWNVDATGLAWQTADGGTVAFGIGDPLRPQVLNSTNAQAVSGQPWNDFIHHNSERPFATKMRPGSGSKGHPSVFKGNVLLVTEENQQPVICPDEGAFQTWHIPSLRAGDNSSNEPGQGTIAPLDLWQTEIYDTGLRPMVATDCSAHWFDFHQAGFVAQAWYNHGLRILDVRDARNIKQVGYFVTGTQEVWSAYFVPRRDKHGQVITASDGEFARTRIVYSIDAARGIDILRVSLPTSPAASTAAVRAPVLEQWLEPLAVEEVDLTPSFTCRIDVERSA